MRRLQIATLVMLGITATLVPLSGFWHASNTLESYGPIAPFSFVGRDGKPLTDQDLSGKVYVVACFFTCCTESCPQLSAAMARLQSHLADLRDFRLVSLTVDPDNDTPEKLNSYAGNYGADSERWLFVSGSADNVNEFVIKRLKLGLEKNSASDATPGNKLLHSSKITLIDRQGQIRGVFDGTNPKEVELLERVIRQLHGQ